MTATQQTAVAANEAPERQRVVCVWCGWQGPSPVKKPLRIAGTDYPLWCRQCNAIGLRPEGEAEERWEREGRAEMYGMLELSGY